MTDTESFALVLLLVAAVGLVVVLSNRLTERLKSPLPRWSWWGRRWR